MNNERTNANHTRAVSELPESVSTVNLEVLPEGAQDTVGCQMPMLGSLLIHYSGNFM